ncbi:50S ribosomal protein L17 [Candidatus Uhrbacteria bacterium]|nr:50S ribosomal protein L17 [Candidatus Uhrbacteria bacterium]
MRHQKKNRKFGREKKERTALLRSLALSLVRRGKIVTTEAKAKELRPYIEKLITHGKEESLGTRRRAVSCLGGSFVGMKSVREIALRFHERKGGYTRIIKLSPHTSAGRKMAVIEFV